MGCVNKMASGMMSYRIWACGRYSWGGVQETSSSVDWILSESRAILLLGVLTNLIWKEEYSEAKTATGKEGAVTNGKISFSVTAE